VFICYNLVKGLRADSMAPAVPGGTRYPLGREPGWRQRLRELYREHGMRAEVARRSREDVQAFLREVVLPALETVAEELRRYDREAVVQARADEVSVTVFHDHREEFFYAVRARTYKRPVFAFPEMAPRPGQEPLYHHAEVYLRDGSLRHDVMGYDRDQVIDHFMHEYGDRLRWWEPTGAARSGAGTTT